MTFKNILSPNQASGGDVLNNSTGLGSWSTNNQSTLVRDTINKVSGTGAIKATSNFLGLQQVSNYISSGSYRSTVNAGTSYALSSNCKVISSTSTGGHLRIAWLDSGSNLINYSVLNIPTKPSTFTPYSVVGVAPAGAVSAYHYFSFYNLSQNDSIIVDQNQFEIGSAPTSWEFPGLWEIGGVPSQQSVNNVALGQNIKPSSVNSAKIVDNIFLKPTINPNSVLSAASVQNIILNPVLKPFSVLSSELINNIALKSNVKPGMVLSAEIIDNILLNSSLNPNSILSDALISDISIKYNINPNYVPSMELVNNLVLSNVLIPLGIISSETVSNTSLNSCIELISIISEEVVGNTEFIQNLILEAIETQETVNDIILYFYYEFMQLLVVTNTHSTGMTMKSDSTKIRMLPSPRCEIKTRH